MELVGVEKVRAARKLLEGVTRVTPMEHARDLRKLHGGPVHLKCENLQRTGSFKIRGAYTRIHGLSAGERDRGVVAASAGNHAQGVALASALLGTKATVFMPQRAPLPKLAATRGYGADVHLHGEVLEETLAEAIAFGERTGAVFIHPFDHADIIAGQGTVGLEILDQVPGVRTVLVSTGGGGLVGGVASAVKALRPEVRIVGVQAEEAAAYPPSLAAGEPVRLREMHTMADGIAVGRPGPISYAHVAALVDDVVTVTEESLSRAVLLCLERRKLVVEPAGAAGVAALMQHPGAFEPPIVAILSGGNVDPVLLLQIVRHGMTAGGRYLKLRLLVPDRPGSLASVLSRVSELGANVLDVEHSRVSGSLALGEVEISLALETRGPSHCAEVAEALQKAGWTVV
ncbi:threonine ammonia-lyase [Amycolatopsis regifaucium]|uniref:L-threonine dehydratase catabolic TdcB n=1 Tax=Amycolatopsis regifaucium TaxID=546365 RepID=A0A154MUH4_9PSEU|nr:threonine ammonia-lyase [Amycolatopsis regifaucium]KZB87583.1 threonine dehydratase [Amycolatopsis regifaucium]OKA08412.1 threonine ammonia-lyase [Amycolatopsis regifaucium]SFI09940.1 threonine dehydratase [Amycolatopsis regifaucium]